MRSASQFSRMSTGSQAGKTLTIVRQIVDVGGNVEEQTEVVSNPAVIRQYVKRRRTQEAETVRLATLYCNSYRGTPLTGHRVEDIKISHDPDQNLRNKQR